MNAQTITLSAWAARRLQDEDVFDRTVQGDAVAFSELYRRYHKRIYGYCLARSLDPETASDATQEVFIRLLRAEPGSIDSPRAWLFAVARNAIIDVARRRARLRETGEIDEDTPAWEAMAASDAADEVLSRAEGRHAFLALRQMNARYRTALILREVHGQSSKDMAEALGSFGVAYAALAGLPAACRASVELIYRRGGSGITDGERVGLEAHLASCARCRAEAKRAASPRHLSALLPFLVPATSRGAGLLRRAALIGEHLPGPTTVQVAPVLLQPHTWSLGARLAAGLLASALVVGPVAGTLLQRREAATATAASSPALRGDEGSWPRTSSMWGGHDSGSRTDHAPASGAIQHGGVEQPTDSHGSAIGTNTDHPVDSHAGTSDLTHSNGGGGRTADPHASGSSHGGGSTPSNAGSPAQDGGTPGTHDEPIPHTGAESPGH
jgi:RNA polymerase sigma-70 factor (ECF subfamily)